jgi:hypothetical protein
MPEQSPCLRNEHQYILIKMPDLSCQTVVICNGYILFANMQSFSGAVVTFGRRIHDAALPGGCKLSTCKQLADHLVDNSA